MNHCPPPNPFSDANPKVTSPDGGTTLSRPDELELHAYADGELSREATVRVALWLEQHPDDAARAMGWQAQTAQLRGLMTEALDEPVPAHLLRALQPASTQEGAQPWPSRVMVGDSRWRGALAACVLLGVGALSGWTGRAWLDTMPPHQAAVVPGFVQDAAIAHAVYTPDKRHPVEVSADQQAHLVQWLSKRLGHPLQAPVLAEQGFHLVGGRLLPGAPLDPVGNTRTSDRNTNTSSNTDTIASARAQFMYENDGGTRLTLYVSALPSGRSGPTAFHHRQQGATRTFYWVDGALGYALSGDLPAERMGTLAEVVYQQLFPAQ